MDDNTLGIYKAATSGGLFYLYMTQMQGLPNTTDTMQYAGLVGASAFAADRVAAMNVMGFSDALEKKQLGVYGLSAESFAEAALASGILYVAYPYVFNGATPAVQSLMYTGGFDVLGYVLAPHAQALITGST
jgi:hypothetical protein